MIVRHTVRPDRDPSRPPAEDFETYAARSTWHWRELLDQGLAERAYHEFLERNPAFLPGAHGFAGHGGHHGPHMSCVISQPKLDGLDRYGPDFMWIARHSGAVIPVLIEIERPSKFWFNLDGTPTSELSQARDQLARWRQWFSEPENGLLFRRQYSLPCSWTEELSMNPRFVLVYGRRDEFNSRPGSRHGLGARRLNKRRQMMARGNEEYMTLDRLRPHHHAGSYVAVRPVADGFRVVGVPPTFQTGPQLRRSAAEFEGWDVALDETARYLPAERVDYLRQRIRHWRHEHEQEQRIGPRPYQPGYE